jgi:hypothetical protein
MDWVGLIKELLTAIQLLAPLVAVALASSKGQATGAQLEAGQVDHAAAAAATAEAQAEASAPATKAALVDRLKAGTF